MNPLAAIPSTGGTEAPSSSPGRSRSEAAPGFSPLLERAMRSKTEGARPERVVASESATTRSDRAHGSKASTAGQTDETSATAGSTSRPSQRRERVATKNDVASTDDGSVASTDAQDDAPVVEADDALQLVVRTEAPVAKVPASATAVERSTERLAPEFSTRLDRVLQRMKDEYGYEVRVTETFRSQARQEQLYAQGRTAPGPTVTWTKNSNHTQGRAADVLVVGGDDAAYAKLAEIAVEEGLRTLGPLDPGHVEMPTKNPRHGVQREGTAAQRGSGYQSALPARVATVAQSARVAEVAMPGVAVSSRANVETQPARQVPREGQNVASDVPERAAVPVRVREVLAQRLAAADRAADVPARAGVVARSESPTRADAPSAPTVRDGRMPPAAGAATIHAAHNSAVTNGIPSRQLRSQSLERGMTLDPAATVAGDEQSTVEGGGAAMDRAPRARLTFEQSRARASLALAAEKDDRTARASDTDSDGIESSGWPLRDLDRNPAQVAADRATLITSALSESSGDHSDLRSALVSEIRQSLSQAAPAEGTAVTPGTDIASRVARLLALQDAARSAPVSGVTLDVGPEDGLATARIRLGLRGPALDALIDIADPAMANRLSGRVEELRRALERTGLEPATVVIREAAAAAVTGRGSNSGAENNTQHEAGRNGWQQRRDPGAADDQKNRRNQKENAR